MFYLIPFQSFAANSLVQGPLPKNIQVNEAIALTPIKNHSFNTDAPQRCGKEKPQKVTEQSVECVFKKPGKFEIRTAICDAQKTYCKIEYHPIQVNGKHVYKNSIWDHSSQNEQKILGEKISIKSQMRNGFYYNSPQEAFKKAKSENKKLFINFYAIWCPPCNKLDELVFSQQHFQTSSNKYIKLKLDVDAPSSWELMKHFTIQSFPTTIIANPNLDEISRRVGFHSVQDLSRWIHIFHKKKYPTVKELENKEKIFVKNEKRYKLKLERLLASYMERRKYQKAFTLAKKLKGQQFREYQYLAALQVYKDDNKKLLKNLTLLVEKYPQSKRYLNHVLKLVNLSEKKKAKKYAKMALKKIDKWLAQKKSSSSSLGYQIPDLYYYQGELFERLENPSAMELSFLKASQFMENEIKKYTGAYLPFARKTYAYYLYRAGKIKEAQSIYSELAQKFPHDFTFNYSYARLLFKLGQLKKSLKQIDKSIAGAYGLNKLMAERLKSQILIKDGASNKAKTLLTKLIYEYEGQKEVPYRVTRMLNSLKNIRKKIKTTKI